MEDVRTAEPILLGQRTVAGDTRLKTAKDARYTHMLDVDQNGIAAKVSDEG